MPVSVFLQPLDLQECTVLHMKDLSHICLELKVQGCGMTFNRFYWVNVSLFHIIQRQMCEFFFAIYEVK